MEVTYNQAKEIALKALAPLGEDYLAKVQEGFDTGWVDVYENVGKRSGAFSWGVYGTHPYVFLNYTNTLNDVFTLVHEMGHAMHTYYSNETQPFVYSEYKIFVAEVASTCNETLLINYLLGNCTDENERKYLINHYLEQFKGTLFRQTMFAEFEMESHKMAEAGEVLNAQNLCALYSDLNKKYFGSEMVIDEEISYEWARIPHFYNPFYVYQYATGFSAAIAIATKILAGDKEVISGYRKFLSGGSSMHPIDLLKLCGVDMSKPQVIQEALDVFDGLLAEF
jgi:oligoendopeptidase F